MAPEEGLEPSTPRLTAACSTIELLWNSEERVKYKPPPDPSTISTRRPDEAVLLWWLSWLFSPPAFGLRIQGMHPFVFDDFAPLRRSGRSNGWTSSDELKFSLGNLTNDTSRGRPRAPVPSWRGCRRWRGTSPRRRCPPVQ